jgi:hypothetical protein
VVPGSPDDRLEEDPDVWVWFVDQDPRHGWSFGGRGSNAASGTV